MWQPHLRTGSLPTVPLLSHKAALGLSVVPAPVTLLCSLVPVPKPESGGQNPSCLRTKEDMNLDLHLQTALVTSYTV